MRSLHLLALTAAALLATQTANALVITTYADRTSWELASARFTVETFDSTPDTFVSNTDLTLDFADFSVTFDTSSHGTRGASAGRLLGDIHGTPAAEPRPAFVAFDFFRPIDAFAMDLFEVGNDCQSFGCNGGVTVATFAGPNVSISFNLLAGTSFFGFVSQDVAFDSLVLTKLSVPQTDNRDHFVIDNVAYSVAEPNPLILVSLAFLILIWQDWRNTCSGRIATLHSSRSRSAAEASSSANAFCRSLSAGQSTIAT